MEDWRARTGSLRRSKRSQQGNDATPEENLIVDHNDESNSDDNDNDNDDIDNDVADDTEVDFCSLT